MAQNVFVGDVAEHYDATSAAQFGPEVLAFLAELAGGRSALELAIGTGTPGPWSARFDRNAGSRGRAFNPERLASITAQTLIVHGDRDHLFPVEIAVEMYRGIPTSYLWVLPNGTHTPFFDGHTESLNEKSLEFLDGNWLPTT